MLLSLNCIVYGDGPNNVFQVDIEISKTVGALKDAIKFKKSPVFNAIPADSLKLYKVSVPVDENEQFQEDIREQMFRKNPLSVVKRLNALFERIEEGHLHVVVGAPTAVAAPGASISQNNLSLNCFVIGDKNRKSIFNVDIGPSKNVAALKRVVKAERKHRFDGVDSTALELWRVSIADDSSFDERISTLKLVDEEALSSTIALAKIFSEQPPDNNVHILIRINSHDIDSKDNVAGLPEFQKYTNLVSNKGKTPSAGAKSKEYVKIQAKENEAIHDGRHPEKPPFSTVAPPVQIFHPIFETFIQLINDPSVQPSKQDLILSQEFIHLLSTISATESARNDAILKKLRKILETGIHEEPNADKTSADSVNMLELNGIRFPSLIIELKNELGDGGCDPSTQAGLSMRRSWIEDNRAEIRDKCCCPTFMIAGGGAWLSVLGGVITDKVIVQRLTDLMWVAHSSTEEDLRVYRFAVVMSALRECLISLENYYKQIPEIPTLIPGKPHPRYFPYPTQFRENDKYVKFEYTRKIEEDSACVTFQAKILDATDSPDIVVKFTARYGKEVHDFLAKENLAPKLRYCGPPSDANIPVDQPLTAPHGLAFGPMLMVVMEFVSECKKVPTNAEKQIRNVLYKLHSSGYVFGDLRRQNVLFDEKENIKFIDFDWAGPYDMNIRDKDLIVCLQTAIDNNRKNQPDGNYVCYPLNLSRSIAWAEGVNELEPIRPQHDWEMLDTLFK